MYLCIKSVSKNVVPNLSLHWPWDGKTGPGYSEARYAWGRCYFNYSDHGVAKLGQGIVREAMTEGVANLTILPTGCQN